MSIVVEDRGGSIQIDDTRRSVTSPSRVYNSDLRDPSHRSLSARYLDEADGVRDGKYYRREIVSARSSARVLDEADGVLDGRYYGRDIVTRSVPSRPRTIVYEDIFEERPRYTREKESDIIIVNPPQESQSLVRENEDLREQLRRMNDRYNDLAFNASPVRHDAALLRRLDEENIALQADYDSLVAELQGRDKSPKNKEENRRLRRELEELRDDEIDLRWQLKQPCRNCGTLDAEIASLRRRIAELEAELRELKRKPLKVKTANPPHNPKLSLEEVEEW